MTLWRRRRDCVLVSLFNVETQVAKARAGECCCGWCAPGALSRDCTEWIRLAAEASR